MTENQLTLRKETASKVVAVGIVKHRPAPEVWNQVEGVLYTSGPQSRAGDGLVMALSCERRQS